MVVFKYLPCYFCQNKHYTLKGGGFVVIKIGYLLLFKLGAHLLLIYSYFLNYSYHVNKSTFCFFTCIVHSCLLIVYKNENLTCLLKFLQ